MAYIDCKLKSQILGTTVGVKLYFPTDLPADVGYTVRSEERRVGKECGSRGAVDDV